MTEIPVVFRCEGDALVGVATPAETPSATGVLILVGGRQYRAGSHRQFTLLARRLAGEGYSVFRFDFRGMGDSDGAQRSFEHVDADIAAAIAAFQEHCPTLRHVVLWGLCDAATAAALYWQRTSDPRVAGLCLVNPWFRSDAGLARARTRYYYPRRVVSADFWGKLFRGKVGVLRSLKEYVASLRAARRPAAPGFRRSMLDGLRAFPGPTLVLLSGRDLTAREFVDGVMADPAGAVWLRQDSVRRIDVVDADHTFSRQSWRTAAEDAVLAWLGERATSFAAKGKPLVAGVTAEGGARIRLLFVCMGNICRSPTAHAVVAAQLKLVGLDGRVEVDSAGTQGQPGGTAPDVRARKAAAQRGYDLSKMRARRISDEDFLRFDCILAMDRDNLDTLHRRCPPEHRHKLGLFLEYSGRHAAQEVPDPYYGSEAGFEHVLDLIEDAAPGLVESLCGVPRR